MNKHNYQKGQIVWTKIKGFPWWPGIIARIFNEQESSENPRLEFLVNFIGDNSHAKVSHEKIWDFDEKYKEFSKQGKSKRLASSIRTANVIKAGLSTYEEEFAKLRNENKRRFQRISSQSRSKSKSPTGKPEKRVNTGKINNSEKIERSEKTEKPEKPEKPNKQEKNEKLSKHDKFDKNDKSEIQIAKTHQSSKDTLCNDTELEMSSESDVKSFKKESKSKKNEKEDEEEMSSQKVNGNVDNLDYLLFSGEFERISRSKAKELHIEHRLNVPIQLENRGIIKKSTEKIRDKFMKKTNYKIKPILIENINWEEELDKILHFLIDIYTKQEEHGKSENEIKKKISFLETICEKCQAEIQTQAESNLDNLAKKGKSFKAVSFLLKCLESSKILTDMVFLKKLHEVIHGILTTIKKNIFEATFDIKDYLNKLNISNTNSNMDDAFSFQDSEKSFSTPPFLFATHDDAKLNAATTVSNFFQNKIFSASPEKIGTINENSSKMEIEEDKKDFVRNSLDILPNNACSIIVKPSMRKKICLKMARTFENSFGMERSKAQKLTLLLENKIRNKYPSMDNDYKNFIKAFRRYLKTNQMNGEDIKNEINGDFEKLERKIDLRVEKFEKVKIKNRSSCSLQKSITTSPMTVKFHKKGNKEK